MWPGSHFIEFKQLYSNAFLLTWSKKNGSISESVSRNEAGPPARGIGPARQMTGCGTTDPNEEGTMRRFLVLPLALVIGIFVLAACSSADEAEVEPTQPTQAPVVQVQPTAPPAQQQPQPTQAPAVQPTQAPPQEPSAVLTASEVIQQAAGEMGVPLQLPQPPANYAPVKRRTRGPGNQRLALPALLGLAVPGRVLQHVHLAVGRDARDLPAGAGHQPRGLHAAAPPGRELVGDRRRSHLDISACARA